MTTAAAPEAEVGALVRAHAGEDAEVHVLAPASRISRLDRLMNAEDDGRTDAAARAETASEAVPGKHVEAQVAEVDPLQAIEDALRVFSADEIVVVTTRRDRRRDHAPRTSDLARGRARRTRATAPLGSRRASRRRLTRRGEQALAALRQASRRRRGRRLALNRLSCWL